MLRIIFNLIAFFILSSSCYASTNWYARDGGGTDTQCTGKTNAVYLGSGTAQPCAFNHPAWALGVGGYLGGTHPSKLSGGDTLTVAGDSDITPGTQAVYPVSYDMPNASGICSSIGKYDCFMLDPPDGSDSSHRTIIIGTGTHKPMLLAKNQVYHAISLGGNHVMFQWFEVTDNQALGYNNPVAACIGGQNPQADGIVGTGDDINMTDIYVHGNCRYGVNIGQFGSGTFTRLWDIGNGSAGLVFGDGGSTSITGTITLNQPIVEWNGCVEEYPITHSGIDNPLMFTNCAGQTSGVYADGVAFGASGSQPAGNWTIIGPGSISFNTQDGLDILHGVSGTGTDNIDKMRFEGNAGQQIKITGAIDNLTNNIIIGNCGWWYQASQSASGAMTPGDSCRASGSTIRLSVVDGVTANFYNNTVITNAIAFEGDNASSCVGTVITQKNNIIQGGYSWPDDTTWNGAGGNSLTTNWYSDGNDGNGGGPCGALVPTEDYNIIYGNKNSNATCVGAHDKCGTVPGFSAGLFPAGTSGGGRTTYYTGQVGISLVTLAGTSAAIGAGVNALPYWNTPTDYYNVIRTNPPAIGALELASCAASNYGCQLNSDCCGGSCVNNACGSGSCTINGGSCAVGTDCCSGICCISTCASSCAGGVSIITQLIGKCLTTGKVSF